MHQSYPGSAHLALDSRASSPELLNGPVPSNSPVLSNSFPEPSNSGALEHPATYQQPLRYLSHTLQGIFNMCHGHPKYHACLHTSMNWHYCPSALIDLDTGYETPCGNTSFAKPRQSNSDCRLRHCEFKDKGGMWTCCTCHQGPNTKGWCTMPTQRWVMNPDSLAMETEETTCDHGCCKDCTRFEGNGDVSLAEMSRREQTPVFRYGSMSDLVSEGSSSDSTADYLINPEATSSKTRSDKSGHQGKPRK